MPRSWFNPDELKEYMVRYFQHWQVPREDAAISAEVLLSADMRGVDSHGVIRLNSYYGSRLRAGLINPLSPMTTIKETTNTIAIDGGNGLGHPISYKTMKLCIEKADLSGIAMATVRNSNHYGIAGYYAMMALPNDMIGISFTNSGPLVAPTHGKKAMLGTNPIAVAVPARSQRPFVLDMATSIVPIGRVTVYDKEKKKIPNGWGINSAGKVTEEPSQVLTGGALMPLGGPEILRGYKGYGLSLMVDIFSGILSGSGFGEGVGNASDAKNCNVGHFFAAIKIEAFRELESFKKDMDALLTQLKESPKAEGKDRIYIHGEKEFEKSDLAASEGVSISEACLKTLIQTGEQDSVPFDLTPLKVE